MSYLTVDRYLSGADKSGDEGNNDDLEVRYCNICYQRLFSGDLPKGRTFRESTL